MMNEQDNGLVSFDDYVHQKACSVPQHRMKDFLDALTNGTEILQELCPVDEISTTTMVYQQQGTSCIYMDSTEVSGSLLELTCPVQVTSADLSSQLHGHQEPEKQFQVQVQIQDQQGQFLQFSSSSEQGFSAAQLSQQEELTEEEQQIQAQLIAAVTGGQQIQLQGTQHIQLPRVKQIQIQPGQHIQLQGGQQIQLPTGFQIKTVETTPPVPQQDSLREADTRSTMVSTVVQPAKKRKVDSPLSVSYTVPPGQPLATVLAIPQGQDQGHMSELLTVDSSELYSTTDSTEETWTIPLYSTPDQQGVTRITFPTESTVHVASPNGKDSLSPMTHLGSIDVQGAAGVTVAGTPEEIVQALFPAHFINGNIHIPLTVQTVDGDYNTMQSVQIWEPSQQQGQEEPEEQLHLEGQTKTESETGEPPGIMNPLGLKPEEGFEIWQRWATWKNAELDKQGKKTLTPIGRRQVLRFQEDLVSSAVAELNLALCLMTQEARGVNDEELAADVMYYIFLCIQKYLSDNGRVDDIFSDRYYARFGESLHSILVGWKVTLHPLGYLIPSHVTEEMLWDCKQLGAHSPSTLLTTLMYFNTKYFRLMTPEQHMNVAFTKLLRHTRKNPSNAKDKESSIRLVKGPVVGQKGAQQRTDELFMEQVEDLDNPLRCPIKLYDFYLFKCPQSVKGGNNAFYMTPELVVAPNSLMWYSCQPLATDKVEQMLSRIMVVREINDMINNTTPCC